MAEDSGTVHPLDSIEDAIRDYRMATADGGEARDGDIVTLLRRVREILGMDIIFIGEFTPTHQVLHHTDTRLPDDMRIDGLATALQDTYCQRMVDARIPQAVPDTANEPAVAELEATRALNVRAYLSTPVTLAGGELYGTLCCLHHTARPELGERQTRSLAEVAQLIAEAVTRGRLLRARRRHASH